jgi:hypothetical protein
MDDVIYNICIHSNLGVQLMKEATTATFNYYGYIYMEYILDRTSNFI